MEYNAVSQRMEVTLTVTTHDFEQAMEEGGHAIENVQSIDSEGKKAIEAYINRHFNVTSGYEMSHLNFIGNEVSLDGTSNWYFESEPMNFQEQVEIRYDVLMEAFPEQQNKVTLYYSGKTYTAAFTPMNKTKQLYFENKEQ
ncbi:MAG: hypothetical protein Crog4KO_01890 [Crocinitomicaceae bacterium]